ncbi:MAG: hypothetical protein AAFS07_01585 [Pseudomonadota bacterium]
MTQATEVMEAWQKPARQAFELWISFFPVAPAFGVTWRFAEGLPFEVPGTPVTPKTAVKPVVKPVAKPVTKPVAKAAPKPAAKAAPKAPAKAAEPAPQPAAKPAPEPAPKPVAVAEAKPAPKPAPKPVAKPAETAAPKAAAPAPAKTAKKGKPAGLLAEKPAKIDDLKMIKGIGPALEKQLNGLGIYQFEQIAGFSEKDLTWVDDNLTAFKGRCFRDDWIGQAKTQIA